MLRRVTSFQAEPIPINSLVATVKRWLALRGIVNPDNLTEILVLLGGIDKWTDCFYGVINGFFISYRKPKTTIDWDWDPDDDADIVTLQITAEDVQDVLKMGRKCTGSMIVTDKELVNEVTKNHTALVLSIDPKDTGYDKKIRKMKYIKDRRRKDRYVPYTIYEHIEVHKTHIIHKYDQFKDAHVYLSDDELEEYFDLIEK